MPITNSAYLEELKKLKQAYADLPWYQRFWFFIWSNNLHSALSAIELDNPANKPTREQIEALYEQSKSAWFFQTIFGLLVQFQHAVATIPFVKGNPFSEVLPPELEQDVRPQEQLSSVQNPQNQKSLFQPKSDVSLLLHHVTRGNHNEVEQMLKKDSTLLTQRGNITDCSGRTFSNISGFEYALWALDKHMWARILDCLPRDEEGGEIKAALHIQYKGIKERGISYLLNGIQITEKHFDFNNTIIKELQTQVDSINAPGTKNWDAIDKQWREGVGGAQNLFPMHVVYEYCSDEPFYPVPKFTSQPKSSKQFYNWATEKDENWFNAGSKLSLDLAIYKVAWGGECRASGRSWVGCPGDLDAMKALCKVRTNDFIALKSQLEDQMTLDNHHQVSQI